jgi:hypothetical protein
MAGMVVVAEAVGHRRGLPAVAIPRIHSAVVEVVGIPRAPSAEVEAEAAVHRR